MSNLRTATRCFSYLIVFLAITTAGCQGKVGPSFGYAVFDNGAPVQSGSIEFRNLKTTERYASRISLDGSFEVVDRDEQPGLPPGKYEVVVVQVVLTEDLAAADHTHGKTVPRRYADYYTSDLRYEVGEGDLEKEIEVVVASE